MFRASGTSTWTYMAPLRLRDHNENPIRIEDKYSFNMAMLHGITGTMDCTRLRHMHDCFKFSHYTRGLRVVEMHVLHLLGHRTPINK